MRNVLILLEILLIFSPTTYFVIGFSPVHFYSFKVFKSKSTGPILNGLREIKRTKPVTITAATGTMEEEIVSTDEISVENTKPNSEESLFDWTKQWYPVLPIEYMKDLDLEKTPFAITILDQDLVIWKAASGEYSILKNKCPHRMTQLSTGKIVNNTLACRYHGWEFDTSGSCTKIPMMSTAQEQLSKAFCVDSFQSQIRGGIFWVYMDPTEPNPPNLPSEIFEYCGEGDDCESNWIVNINPVSYYSMIENSLDPSHAPFTHEGGMFSPNSVVPMQYELTTNITKLGFSLKHSPYQSFPGSKLQMDSIRTFISPVTSLSSSPFLNSTIFFVPTKAGESMTIAKFTMTRAAKKKSNILPKKISSLLSDFVHFYMFTSDGNYRFLTQDRLIMQGQDRLKTQSNKWEDMYPAKSDVGVRTMQTWSRTFGRPAFTMPSKDDGYDRPMTVWDSHAKFCPKCIRCIKYISKLSGRADKVSKATLITSLLAIIMSLVMKKSSNVFVKSSVLSLLLSVSAKYLSTMCSKLVERVFVNPYQNPKYAMMEIYKK